MENRRLSQHRKRLNSTLDSQEPTKMTGGNVFASQSVKRFFLKSSDSHTKKAKISDSTTQQPWKEHVADPLFWGPYLAERQWGTCREDYSFTGNNWDYLDHSKATHQAYMWGEDGLLGISDKFGLLCASLALWNGKDEILKERLFGLNGNEGNHGEDCKELYYFLDNTPRHTYMRALYKYPQRAFPYHDLRDHRRTVAEPEFELLDTGVFNKDEYWDVFVEYAKPASHTVLCRYTVYNRSKSRAKIHIIPQFLFRNTWKKSGSSISIGSRPVFQAVDTNGVDAVYDMGIFRINFLHSSHVLMKGLLFTNNESLYEEIHDSAEFRGHAYSHSKKDAFHRYIIKGEKTAIKEEPSGTKFGAWMIAEVDAGGSATVCWQMYPADTVGETTMHKLEHTIHLQKNKADDFIKKMYPKGATDEEKNIIRQAVAGMLWSKQLYIYNMEIKNREQRRHHTSSHNDLSRQLSRRHKEWNHLNCHDILLMPDTWEFPWFAAWDLAFHCIQFARVDSQFSKEQILLLLSDRYMHPNGQIPGCEFDLGDSNPPLLAWAVWKLYQMESSRDIAFLKTCFNRLIFSFQWWNKLDPECSYTYGNGFLGLDNISLINRSKLPVGMKQLKQADATGWMAMFCLTMLQISLELCISDNSYTDMSIKFLKHFLYIARAINKQVKDGGLWLEEDQFFYDVIHYESGHFTALKLKSWTGMVPMLACCSIDLKHSPLVETFLMKCDCGYSPFVCKIGDHDFFLTVVTYSRVKNMTNIIFNEEELLSPYGIRSLSKSYEDEPYKFDVAGKTIEVNYLPGESDTTLFGGNSNWRGPVWLCMNYLFVECLEKYSGLDKVFTQPLGINYPVGRKTRKSFLEIASDLCRRMISIFLPDKNGNRPVHGGASKYQEHDWRNLILFYEYFHSETGRGCGANHQTGWTALVVDLIHKTHSYKKK